MKKMFFSALLGAVLSFALAGCGMEAVTTEVSAEQHYFEAEVLEISDGYLLVRPQEETGESAIAGEVSVSIGGIGEENSLNVISALEEGDMIGVSYLGPVAETWPAQIDSAYKIEEITPAVQELFDYPPAVMVDGELYFDTGHVSKEARCGMLDGQISSAVDAAQLPTQDDQSNFGSGYGYQYGREGTIEVNLNGNWYIFEKREG